ncbi:MAG: hypothetical protein HXN43_07665 [Prevotella micans]|jgi:hypothetical protein|nr:hypothetical protein [Prevotella micans]
MNRKGFRKQTYVCPSIKVFHTNLEGQLMQTSFPNDGGHNKAGDDGDLNAKQDLFEYDEEEDKTSHKWEL